MVFSMLFSITSLVLHILQTAIARSKSLPDRTNRIQYLNRNDGQNEWLRYRMHRGANWGWTNRNALN